MNPENLELQVKQPDKKIGKLQLQLEFYLILLEDKN